MEHEPVDIDQALRMAQRGRLIFFAVLALAVASGPITAYFSGVLDPLVLVGPPGSAVAAGWIGLPIFNNEIRRLRRKQAAEPG